MACTKQTYTATATWTPSDLAQLFEDAFIDAGLMTAWYDSFLDGSIENRVLEVTYDGSKTYGKTYYWFVFSTSGVYLHVATGWDAPNNVPSGTQYLDYFSTTTNSTSNHWQMFAASTSNTVELVRYTSGVDADQSWFVLKSSTTRHCFTIANGAMTVQSWIDLNNAFYPGFASTALNTLGGRNGVVQFRRGPSLRRDAIIGSALNGATSSSNFSSQPNESSLISYGAVGNQSNDVNGNYRQAFGYTGFGSTITLYRGSILLPVNFSGTNPAFTSNSNPVFHSMPFMPYITQSLPADFGLTFHYATNTFSQGDTFVVSAGTEEWEVLDFAANSSAVTGASPLFLARMV